MEDIYLTPELKTKYMIDFNEKVLTCEKESWKLDDGVRDFLIRINTNPHIQTTYSKRHQFNSFSAEHESYLKFTYTSDVEQQIFKSFLPDVTATYCWGSDDDKSYYQFYYPKLEEDDYETNIDLGCTKDGSYFNVNQIKLYLQSYSTDVHQRFWEDITKRLEVLKPE